MRGGQRAVGAGLFHRAIAMSGNALAPHALAREPRRSALAIRRHFAAACPGAAPDEVVSCLQRVPARDLVHDQLEVPVQPFQNYFAKFNIWRPSIEAAGSSSTPFLSADPEQNLREGKFNTTIPLMTGVTSAEGILYLAWARLLRDPSRWAEVDAHFEDIFRWEMPQGLRTKEAARAVRDFYFGNSSLADANDHLETLKRFVQMLTDVNFAVSARTTAQLMAQRGAKVFLYLFNRDGPIAFTKQAMNATRIQGVTHGDDLPYLFDFLQPGSTEPRPIPYSERSIRLRQATVFADMAKFGNPTPEGSGLRPWPAYAADSDDYMYMVIEMYMRRQLLRDRTDFWQRLLDSRAQPPRGSPASDASS